jgi:hypothetical protein
MVRALLVLVLVMGVLFAWRAWRQYPGLAGLAAAVATVMGMLLLRSPVLALVGLGISAWLISKSNGLGPRR